MEDRVRARITIDFTGMMESLQNQNGFSEAKLQSLQKVLDEAQTALLIRWKAGEIDFSKLLVSMKNQLSEISEYANAVSSKFDNFVVLGIGGSALGPLAVHQALNHYYYNELPPEKRGHRPRFYVMDNIDPVRFSELLQMLDPSKTLFNVISKSGNTSETMAQFLIVRDTLRRVCGDSYAEHIVVTTDKEKGNLLPIALTEGYQRFVIPAGIGGRFSELTPVGLLAAAICGIDVHRLLEGALEMDQWIRETQGVFSNPAQLRAALALLSWQKGKNISVFMPYADGLKTMADWYAQLWAESLGKRYDRQGRVVHVGQTPVKALGVTDQHSQVQLYAEGPDDKVITFVVVEKFKETQEIPIDMKLPEDIRFLGGKTLDELLWAEQKATEYALTLAGRQHQKILLPRLDAYSVGQLLLLLEWETAYMGELLNINAFDQPGVEEGKNGTYALMGRNGYEAKKHEIEEYGKTRYSLNG
ncbi:glucose-6-phosphate isomerase [Desulfosporosinus metallidurans]|uniref:Glucose-6-phosphate isomerase n=1 Tax=Desulfosporosinus metallidurans TaxID=1888891 RepID=A0A1Q8R244_9FIRM|nr:glucose-6-phosphate isomerase [Desulfosporosinus metallidurans]OLN33676.1 Glucose-6-phosphate isomerase [Desulfosporosinus metallidurans]